MTIGGIRPIKAPITTPTTPASATLICQFSARPFLSRSICSSPQLTIGRSLGLASRSGVIRNWLRNAMSSMLKPLERNFFSACSDELIVSSQPFAEVLRLGFQPFGAQLARRPRARPPGRRPIRPLVRRQILVLPAFTLRPGQPKAEQLATALDQIDDFLLANAAEAVGHTERNHDWRSVQAGHDPDRG